VSTLLFSLFDKHLGLDAWCEHFKIAGKLKEPDGSDYTPSGRVTPKELAYCQNDVLITQRILNEALRELDTHDLPDLLADNSYSPASLGKALLRKLAIKLPEDKFSDFSDKNQGIAMAAYYGGRTECHIRRTKVPVMRLDFLSQYPTVNTLLKNWDVLTAESVSFVECTDEVRKLLNRITADPDLCYDPKLWPEFKFFAKVYPERDILPVRASFDPSEPKSLNIASAFLTSDRPLYYAGPDIITSTILTGKVPKIEKSFRLVGHGKQGDGKQEEKMYRIKLMRTIPVDPDHDDLFKCVIEHRHANEKNKPLKHALKIIANSTSYGAYVELNEEKQGKPAKLEVYSGDDYRTLSNVKEVELPGKWFFAPLASLICSGGRLLLAMVEKYVTDAGKTWIAADTDSMMVVANKNGTDVAGARPLPQHYIPLEEGSISKKEFAPIPALSWEGVQQLSDRFISLNPYSFSGSILKIEDVNHEDDDPKKPFRTVWGYSISSKRYILWTTERGKTKIVDAKGHGLGFLMPPLKTPKNWDKNKKWDKKWPYWIEAAWLYVLKNELIIHKPDIDLDWLDLPAMMQIPVSSPAVLGRLKDFTKPFDFVLAPNVSKSRLKLEKQADKPILITRYTRNPAEWLKATYFNVRTGKPCRITLGESRSPDVIPVKSYRQVLNQYPPNPEHKSLAAGGLSRCDEETRGILERDHVIAGGYIPCGKEMKSKLEEGFVCHPDEKNKNTSDTEENTGESSHVRLYSNGQGRVKVSASTKKGIRSIGSRELRRRGIGQHTIESALSSTIKVRTLKRILSAIENYKQEPIPRRTAQDVQHGLP
jgi:hypothetical protein